MIYFNSILSDLCMWLQLKISQSLFKGLCSVMGFISCPLSPIFIILCEFFHILNRFNTVQPVSQNILLRYCCIFSVSYSVYCCNTLNGPLFTPAVKVWAENFYLHTCVTARVKVKEKPSGKWTLSPLSIYFLFQLLHQTQWGQRSYTYILLW